MSYTHFTVEEVAEHLKVSPHRIYEACRLGLLPHTRIGRQVRIPEKAFMEWVEKGGQALSGGWRVSK